MATNLLDTQHTQYRLQIDEVVKDLHQMTIDIGNHELGKTLSDLRSKIHEPFLFVIVGEVKTGKSSFVNALLATGKEVAKVAPDPCTDTIQQIIYGEEEETFVVNEHFKKIQLPVEILKEIAIVDTPGTNTISEHHQEITERFIPGSDLIVFVFEAKNPYRQSAWDFFDYIHKDWHKKVIFVLQQADLMSAEDLAINVNGVKTYAEKKGINDPFIFPVSAKLEIEGNSAESGFPVLRTYIAENITGGKAPRLKLENNLQLAGAVNEKIQSGLDDRAVQLKSDREFRTDVQVSLDRQEERSARQVDQLVESLLRSYDKVTGTYTAELSEGLSFFTLLGKSFKSIFNKQESAQNWVNDLTQRLEKDLKQQFDQELNEGVDDIAESIQQMARIIDLKIRNNPTLLTSGHEVFGDIADRRRAVLRELQDEFAAFMKRTDEFVGAEAFPDASTFSPNLAAGSGIATIGVILAAVTNGMALDITGGILTSVGLLFAGVTVMSKRNKIIGGFKNEIAKGREQLKTEIDTRLKDYIRNIKSKIDGKFADFDALLTVETEQLNALNARHDSIDQQLGEMRENLV